MLVAIYCRLSREDEDKRGESESIQNQKSLLLKYAVDKEWDIYKIYSDDDYSGSDRNRPKFNEMLEDAKNKCFDIILVKTQSRFTRDMEMVEKYIHGLFMIWGIRFVAALDNTDTSIKGTKKARQISGLINEWYLEDLSDNIKAVFDNKRKNGNYIGPSPVYGYLLDNTEQRKFVVDTEAAVVVKRIYNMYLSGAGMQKIARDLNAEGVPNPTKHKQELGMKFRNGYQKNNFGLWNTTTLSRMLRDQTYTGDLVQGRTKSISYKIKGTAPTPRDKWVVVPQTHEPIIDKETFFLIQEMISRQTKICHDGEIHSLAGKVFCADCNSVLHKHNNGNKNGHKRSYLRCQLYTRNHKLCTCHSTRLDTLENMVLSKIKEKLSKYYKGIPENEIVMQEDQAAEKEALAQITKLEKQISEITFAMKTLYLDKSRGIVEEDQFIELNTIYCDDKKCLTQRVDAIKTQSNKQDNNVEKKEQLKNKIRSLEKPKSLSRELVNAFICRIEIGEKNKKTGEQEVKIEWNF